MKKFFKKTEGFTLVELIVVIAILGILAGVGTVGYSGYIKKANMAADQQTISAIRNAVQLGTLANNGGVSGAITVTKDGAKAIDADGKENGVLHSFMVATFGEGYATSLKTKTNWEDDGKMNAYLNQEDAEYVHQSAYMKNATPAELLGDVQVITNAAMSFLSNKTDGTQLYKRMNEVLPAGELDAMLSSAGLSDSVIAIDNGDGTTTKSFDVANNPNLSTQLSNMMVLAVTNEIETINKQEGGVDAATTMASITLNQGEMADISMVTRLAMTYAAYEAAVFGVGDAKIEANFNKLNNDLNGAASLADVNRIMGEFAGNSENAEMLNYWVTFDDEGTPSLTDAYSKDIKAFSAIMEAANGVSGDYMNGSSLGDSGLFTSSGITNHLNAYTGAIALKGSSIEGEMQEALAAGGIVAVVSPSGDIGIYPAAAN